MVCGDGYRVMGDLPSHRERCHPHRRSPGIPQLSWLAVRGCADRCTPATLPGHAFWKDDLCLVESDLVDIGQIATPGQVTDTYLLALAVANKGQLATFDRRLSPKAVRRGRV